jgi:hypothetical protein
VRITVLPEDANRAPLPETLEGRVLSGGSTLLEFDGFGMDPDGDVVTLDRIMDQPQSGAATISADGTSILYSSVPGYRGQVSFTYRVVDSLGATGEGTVRIGVLDGQSNPSPITFTDYVQVQAGPDSRIRISPLSNDIDPTLQELSLEDVRPDLPQFLADGSPNPDYDRLDDMIRSRNDTTVVVDAGTEPTTMSFLYDVKSESGNTGRGLIVVRVVRESVPDYPVVADTVLTVENRDDFAEGVDVLAGKVAWAAGEVDDLAVSLWGDQTGVEVDGRRISGDLPRTTRLIPFAVTGEGPSGPVTTYAFLRVPGEDDLSLTLRSGAPTPEVRELESVTFDMASLVARPAGSVVEVSGEALRPSGARSEASCSLESGTTVRYTAGAGAPWVDSCQVPVRLAGQDDWTVLSVPLVVLALDPQPELHTASLTVGPGETATFDLRQMTTWQLREGWGDIDYAVDYSGSAFQVTQSGSTVTVVGADRAVPGSEDAAIVTVTSHNAVAPARLILRVGAAPSTLPQGGSLSRQCSQASGSSCTFEVVGAAGEINPLPRTPLELIEVRPTGACAGVSFEVASATTVTASWAQDAPGATCTAAFSMRDAQGRRTNAERDGRIVLDLLGYPKSPASVRQTAYGDGTVTLRVDPGEARLAYPALSGFIVRSNGQQVARCAPDGTCPDIAAPNGEQRAYDVVAVNSVGESRSAVRTVAWAYNAPGAPASVTVAPVVTSGEGGVVSLSISGIDGSQVGGVEITSPDGETARVPVSPGRDSVEVDSYRVGTNSRSPITITPYSRFSLPPGLGGSAAGASTTVWGNGIGAPRDPALTLSSASQGDGTSTVTARGAAGSGGDDSTVRYGIVREGQRCTPTADGQTATFTGLADGEEYRFTLCVDSWYDGRSYGSASTTTSVRAQQSGRAPQGWTFAVDARPNVGDGRAEWTIKAEPSSGERVPNRNRVELSGWPTGIFGRDPGIQVRYVHELWGTATSWSTVQPAAGSAPYQVQATWDAEGRCQGGGALAPRGTSTDGKATFSFGNGSLVYYDKNGKVLAHTADTWDVPRGAVRVEGIRVTVGWAGSGWGLNDASATFAASCTPNDAP